MSAATQLYTIIVIVSADAIALHAQWQTVLAFAWLAATIVMALTRKKDLYL